MGGLRTPRLVGRRRLARDGFTIVETMIVLAVTGVLFVSFVATISGRQDRVRFQQSVNAIKGELEQIINEAQTGYFPSNAQFHCTISGGNLNIEEPDPANPVGQGRNEQCVFLGKVLQFGTAFGTDMERYAIYTIAGQNNANDFESSTPKVVAFDDGTSPLTETKPLQNGLSVQRIWYGEAATAVSVGAVGFTTYFATQDGSPFGRQSVQVIPVGETSFDNDGIAKINENLKDPGKSPHNPAGGVKMCFTSGTTDQSGLITLGGGSGVSGVTLEIKNGKTCGL